MSPKSDRSLHTNTHTHSGDMQLAHLQKRRKYSLFRFEAEREDAINFVFTSDWVRTRGDCHAHKCGLLPCMYHGQAPKEIPADAHVPFGYLADLG